jgi:hypothetical protein
MIGGEQGAEERFLACEDLAGTGVVCGVHGFCLFLIGQLAEAPPPRAQAAVTMGCGQC